MTTSKLNKISPNHHNDKETQWITTEADVKLRVRCLEPSHEMSGNSGSKALIFIHGVGGSSDVWGSQLQYFSKRGYHVIAPDLIGHGFSSAPDKCSLYTFESMRKHCLDVFDQMCKDTNVIVGHSYGTSFAAYLASQRQEKISKLVLLSGGAPVALGPQSGVLSLPSFLLSCLRPALSRLFYKNAFHRKNKNLPNKEKAFDVPPYVLRYTMKGQRWEAGNEEFHSKLSQPTLLLHGVDDQLEAASATLQMHQTLMTSELYYVDEASHMIMMEQPTIVNKLIERFLNSDSSADDHVEGGVSPLPTPRSPTETQSTHVTKSQPNLRLVALSS